MKTTLLIIAVLSVSAIRAESPGPTPTATPAPVVILPGRKAPLEGGSLQTPPAGGSQSLADMVRHSREGQDAGKKKSLGTITNETLKGGAEEKPKAGTGRMTTIQRSEPITTTQTTTQHEPRDSHGRSEEDWKRAVAETRDRAVKAEAEAQRLESEVKRLENDFYAWSDGNYRDNVIKPNWDQAREDLKKAQAQREQAEKAQADLAEAARKAGAPPGWLRGEPKSQARDSKKPPRTPNPDED